VSRRNVLQNNRHGKRITKRKKYSLDTEYAARIFGLEMDNAKQKEALEEQYREKIKELEHRSNVWSGEVDDGIKVVKNQIDHEKHVWNTERKSVESDDNDDDQKRQRRPDPMSLLQCPITKDTMVDPVVAEDGHTYERSAIKEVFAEASRGRVLSPISGEPLAHRQLIPNMAVRAMTLHIAKK